MEGVESRTQRRTLEWGTTKYWSGVMKKGWGGETDGVDDKFNPVHVTATRPVALDCRVCSSHSDSIGRLDGLRVLFVSPLILTKAEPRGLHTWAKIPPNRIGK